MSNHKGINRETTASILDVTHTFTYIRACTDSCRCMHACTQPRPATPRSVYSRALMKGQSQQHNGKLVNNT